jgi:tetratricopeptide (TPR) repeat protein
MPEDVFRCVRCGFESQQSKIPVPPKLAVTRAVATPPEKPATRLGMRLGWPSWWFALAVALALVFAPPYLLRLLPSARMPLLVLFAATVLAGIVALVLGIVSTARRSKVKAALLGILAAVPQFALVALLVPALIGWQQAGDGDAPCGSESVRLEGQPASAAAYYQAARTLHENFNGQTAALCRARALIREALKLDANHAPSFVEAAWVEARLGYISSQNWQPEALARSRLLIEQALKLDPQLLDAWIEAGYGRLREKDIEGARQCAAEAQRRRTGAPEVQLLLASVARREGNLKDAVALAKDALPSLRTRNQKVTAYEILTEAYRHWEDFESADQIYRRIIDLDPRSPWSHINYAGFLVNSVRDYDRAIEHAETALREMDFPAAHFTLSQAYYGKAIRLIEREQFEEAAPLLRLSLKHLPSNANAHYAMGLYYDFRGETSKAEKALRTALKYQPNHAAARDALQQIANGK